jgi:hypothetical protein
LHQPGFFVALTRKQKAASQRAESVTPRRREKLMTIKRHLPAVGLPMQGFKGCQELAKGEVNETEGFPESLL